MANYGALATMDDDAAIAEIASGTLSKTIAARYGVTPYAVRKRLQQHPDYKAAVAEQAESMVEQATELAMTCGNEDVAIARARVDAAHKWAASRDPVNWGQKQQVLNITLVSADSAFADVASSLLDQLRAVPQLPQCITDNNEADDAQVIEDKQE